MDNGSGQGDAWAKLIREVIASWPLVIRTAVLVLAGSPLAAVVVLMILATR